jgi:hypothetical protein
MPEESALYISSLTSGETYIVIKEFTDYDGVKHPVGEKFEFDVYDYFPHDAGYTIYVRMDGKDKAIRLGNHEKRQAHVVRALGKYVKTLRN